MPPEAAYPGPHPLPVDDLQRRPLPLIVTGQSWYRIHRIGDDALHFGESGGSRFDAPGREFGVLYAGSDAYCAFIETLGRRIGERNVHVHDLRARMLVRIDVGQPLRLVDLTGSGLARLGADERLCTGDYAVARQWSLALFRHPESPDGLYFRSRHDPSRPSVAIFSPREPNAASLLATEIGSLAGPEHAELLADILETYGFGLLDDVTSSRLSVP